jgi:hypothetical protein
MLTTTTSVISSEIDIVSNSIDHRTDRTMDRLDQTNGCVITSENLLDIVSELNVVDMHDETMDPLEWAIRKVIPIPKVYYWELIPTTTSTTTTMTASSSHNTAPLVTTPTYDYGLNDRNNINIVTNTTHNISTTRSMYSLIPIRIKIWHTVIAIFDSIQDWTSKMITEPIVSMAGFTGSQIEYSTNDDENNVIHEDVVLQQSSRQQIPDHKQFQEHDRHQQQYNNNYVTNNNLLCQMEV